LLRSVSHVPCIQVCAPMELRVRRLMERLETDDEDLARREIQVDDAGRAARMGEYFNVAWGDPTPYEPPPNTQRAPDWNVIQGANCPKWVYKSWHLGFTRKGDKPGSTAHDGADNLTWNTLKFVPPVPKLTAPQSVAAAYRDGAYVLTHKDGRALFTGTCRKNCADWSPLTAPAAGRGLGEWTVSRSGDAPQWLYRGKPVYVGAALDTPAPIPAKGKVLRP